MRWITYLFFYCVIISGCTQRPNLKLLQGDKIHYTWKEHEVSSFEMATVEVCQSIPKYEVRFPFLAGKGNQCSYTRSRCFQSIAQKLLDPQQCEHVHELRTPFLNGAATSKEACLRLVEKAKSHLTEYNRRFDLFKITSMSAEIVGQKLNLILEAGGNDLSEYELEVRLDVNGSMPEEIHPEDKIFSRPLGHLEVPVDKIEVARQLHLTKGQYLSSVHVRLLPKGDRVKPESVRGCTLTLKTKSYRCYY